MCPCLDYVSTSEYTLTDYTAWPFVSNRERARVYKKGKRRESMHASVSSQWKV